MAKNADNPPENAPQSAPRDRLWRPADLAYFLGLSIHTVYTAICQGRHDLIPPPFYLGGDQDGKKARNPRWRPEDVDRWVAKRAGDPEPENPAASEPQPARRRPGRPRRTAPPRTGGQQ